MSPKTLSSTLRSTSLVVQEEKRRQEEAQREKRKLENMKLAASLKTPLPTPAKPSPPIYKRWWFWTLVGASVVATTATIIVLSPEDDPIVSGTMGDNPVIVD